MFFGNITSVCTNKTSKPNKLAKVIRTNNLNTAQVQIVNSYLTTKRSVIGIERISKSLAF